MKYYYRIYCTHTPLPLCGYGPVASFFFGARIWLGTILCRFSINYFSCLGLKVMVWVWVRVMVRVGVRVSVVIWSV